MQVRGSSVVDESSESLPELVAGGERFLLRKFPKKLPFSEQGLALGSNTM